MKQATNGRSLRRQLLDGETLYGLVIKVPSPALVEMCAAAGFNFAFIDGEHGSGEALELEHHVRAAESFGMPATVLVGKVGPVAGVSKLIRRNSPIRSTNRRWPLHQSYRRPSRGCREEENLLRRSTRFWRNKS